MSWRNRAVRFRRGYWPLSGDSADYSGYGNDGTLVNTPTWASTPWGRQCAELDGFTQHINLGDVAALNAVPAFSIAFWMNQDVLDVTAHIFYKGIDANNRIDFYTHAGGSMYFLMRDAATWGRIVDYSPVLPARNWSHVAVVFDGARADNAGRLVVYVDGVPATLGFSGTIPATTLDLSGQDATIGQAVASFDGKISEVLVLSAALSRDEVNDLMRGR